MDYYIYCDESCHTFGKNESFMGFGAFRIPKEKIEIYKKEINELKKKFNANAELKFTKIHKSRYAFYEAIIDWIGSKDDFLIRTLIVEKADQLDHTIYNSSNPDIFYYKMQYLLLSHYLEINIEGQEMNYSILLDYKDSMGGKRVNELKKIFGVAFHSHINGLYLINSRDSVFIQLVDFILGLVVYKARGLKTNDVKLSLIKKLERTYQSLDKKTRKGEMKFNRFIFTPR